MSVIFQRDQAMFGTGTVLILNQPRAAITINAYICTCMCVTFTLDQSYAIIVNICFSQKLF